jgi:deoxyribodipyrimidine photolyase
MSQKKITAAEFDKAKETVYSWVSDYEDILEKAKPSIMKREKEVEDAIMDHEEDVEDTLEEAVEDFESNGKLLEKVVTRSEEQAMD